MASHAKEDAALDDLQFAHDFAAIMQGFPPIAGRMFGLLLITDKPALSSRELMDLLDVSSASISNMGRMLVRVGLVDRTVSPETRRDVFSLRSGVWDYQFRRARESVDTSLNLLESALEQRSDSHSHSREKLMEMRDYYAFLQHDEPRRRDEFEKWRANRDASRSSDS